MHATDVQYGEQMVGHNLGFYGARKGNHTVIEHAGDIKQFATLASLSPNEDIGFFISSNTNAGGGTLRNKFANFFYNYYLGEGTARIFETNGADDSFDIEPFAGVYSGLRVSQSSPDKLFGALMGQTSIEKTSENSILVSNGGVETVYNRLEANVFKADGKDHLLTLEMDMDGRAYYTSEVIPGYESNELNMMGKVGGMQSRVLVLLLGVIALSVLYMVIQLILKFVKKEPSSTRERRVKTLMIGASTAIVAVGGGYIMMLMSAMQGELGRVMLISFILIHMFSFVLVILSLVNGMMTYKVWKEGFWTVKGRVMHTTMYVVQLMAVVVLASINCFTIGYLI